jgi:hypothetical protein
MQQPFMLFLHVIYFFVIIILVLQPFVPSALVSPLSPSFLPSTIRTDVKRDLGGAAAQQWQARNELQQVIPTPHRCLLGIDSA